MTDLNSPHDQPITTGGFDTHCAWCTKPWDQHEGGKPGEPGGPSTCPPSAWQLDQVHAVALAEFAKACTDTPEYRMTRKHAWTMSTKALGMILEDMELGICPVVPWVQAVLRDELHSRALVERARPCGPISLAALNALKTATVQHGTHIIDLSTGADPDGVGELLARELVVRRTAVTFALTSGAVSLRLRLV